MVINIFCDASINENFHLACAGSFITCQNDDNSTSDMYNSLIIQTDATNNSAEILAIWIGVNEALKLRNSYPNAIFRLFSDSKISLYGLRDWIKNWVVNIKPDGTLISSSGKPVMNQQRFIDIFNLIVRTNLRIELYHQRGHVGEHGIDLTKARTQFIRANKVSPERLGLPIEYLSRCNSVIDDLTRKALKGYIAGFVTQDKIFVERAVPMIQPILKDKLPQYIDLINKSSVFSHHDFKGGYSQ